jgi:hypothetical protein
MGSFATRRAFFAADERFTINDETFVRGRRYASMTQPDIWYVAFGPDKTIKTDINVTGSVRSTRTFKTEVDAKLFATQILAKGWSASAGTLNPHQPKKIVGPSEMEQWADRGLGG